MHVWYIDVSVLGGGVNLEVNLQHMEFEEFMGQLSKVAPRFSQRHEGLHTHILKSRGWMAYLSEGVFFLQKESKLL